MKSLRWSILAAILTASALAAGCGGGDDDDGNPMNPGPTPDATITINGQVANAYSPDPDTVTVGQTVAWRNNNGTLHNATADGGAWASGNVNPGARSSLIQMNTAGTFDYHCTIHPGMTGTLVVIP